MSDCLQSPVDSNINSPTTWGTSTREVLNFHAELLDWIDHGWHFVAFVWIPHKQGNNIPWYCCNEWFENSSTHWSIAPHLSMCSPNNSTQTVENIWNSLALILPFCLPLKINIGDNFVPSAHTITARVAFLVSCVVVQMLTVFIPLIFKVHL